MVKKHGRYKTTLMGLQAGLPPLDFGGIRGELRQKYFFAVQAGLNYDSSPMASVFRTVLKRSLRQGETVSEPDPS